MTELHLLIDAVQRNCYIADARHAREMSLCTYLLEMREFYRWEQGIPLGETMARGDVGAWLSEREALWETLAEDNYDPLPVAGEKFDPFASGAINQRLAPHGLVYGAGIGRFGKPHFFLGQLAYREETDGLTVLVCEREYARDLSAIPAALQNGVVIVRREALRQWLWEKAEGWSMKKTPGTMARALAAHGYADDPRLALERMTDAETASVILHERGEHAAGGLLGPDWEKMLAGFKKRRPEILARAVRDNLADCLVTLPALIERAAWPQLHFWFTNFDGMRKEMFPLLAAFDTAKVGAGPSQADVPPVGGSEPGLRARGAIKVGAGPSQADVPPVTASGDFMGGSKPGLRARGAIKVGAGGTAQPDHLDTATAELQEIVRRGAEHWHAVASNMLDRYRTDAVGAEDALESLSHDLTTIKL